MAKWRSALSIVAATCVLLTVAGCAGNADALHTVRSAATNTLGLTAQSTLKSAHGTLFGEHAKLVGRGEFSFSKGLGYGALQVPARGAQPSGTAYLVFLPAKLWIRPASNASLPDGRLWLSTRLSDPATPSLALVAEAMNPELLLEEIAKGAVAASSSGHRVVDHVPYTEYRVSVDVKRALQATDTGALRIAMQQQLAALRTAGAGSRLQIVARVDGAERLAQLTFSLPGSKLGTIELSLWKFGSVIPLSLPLASETVDMTSLRLAPGSLPAARLFSG